MGAPGPSTELSYFQNVRLRNLPTSLVYSQVFLLWVLIDTLVSTTVLSGLIKLLSLFLFTSYSS